MILDEQKLGIPEAKTIFRSYLEQMCRKGSGMRSLILGSHVLFLPSEMVFNLFSSVARVVKCAGVFVLLFFFEIAMNRNSFSTGFLVSECYKALL